MKGKKYSQKVVDFRDISLDPIMENAQVSMGYEALKMSATNSHHGRTGLVKNQPGCKHCGRPRTICKKGVCKARDVGCWNCGEYGHTEKICWNRKQEQPQAPCKDNSASKRRVDNSRMGLENEDVEALDQVMDLRQVIDARYVLYYNNFTT